LALTVAELRNNPSKWPPVEPGETGSRPSSCVRAAGVGPCGRFGFDTRGADVGVDLDAATALDVIITLTE